MAAMTLSSFSGSTALDDAVNQALREHRMPGAVLIVGHNGHIVYRKAFGNRAEVPSVEPMTLDTIFDCASLTKVISTTTCLMKLFEEGRFRLNDPITDYIPEFQGGHSDITIRNLMTHFSGLRPDLPLTPAWSGYDTAIKMACADPPEAAPGERHVYSDINFELLGELVHRLSGEPLNEYAHKHIFIPLGMKDTMYLPPASLIPRIAPTEKQPNGEILRGVVHDPTARNMGGVAGHAGLFSTGDDLARFAQMMLNMGKLDGKRLLSSATIAKFTEPQTPPDQPILRGLGWDIDSPYSTNRGELFPIGSYGHTGFTGHIGLDRPVQQDLRDPADESRPQRAQALRDRPSDKGRDDRRCSGRNHVAARLPDRLQRNRRQLWPAPSCRARGLGTNRPRCA